MLTRITRYTLLVLCLLVAGVWGWSYWRCVQLRTFRCLFGADSGIVYGGWGKDKESAPLLQVQSFDPKPDYREPASHISWELLGFQVVNISGNVFGLIIPMWMLCTPIAALTAATWYRPIRNRLRGKRDAGFEVEPKQPEPVKE